MLKKGLLTRFITWLFIFSQENPNTFAQFVESLFTGAPDLASTLKNTNQSLKFEAIIVLSK